MNRAYVGIADYEGLESFLPEGLVPLDWLVRRASARCRLGAVCYWAAVRDEIAHEIRGELILGRRAVAMTMLQGLAVELVPVAYPEMTPGSSLPVPRREPIPPSRLRPGRRPSYTPSDVEPYA
jgi:hypothetical protein